MPNTNYDQTVSIVRNAIPRMSELRIPITPINYAVWYEYLTESNQGLRQEMDALLDREQPITDSEMSSLYERYLEQRSENIQVAKTALSQVVNTLLSHIDHADGHFSSFSSELGDIASSLDGETSVDDLNQLMDRAMQATNAALERGAEMKHKLSSLAAEMDDVRDKLARSQEEARVDALTGVNNRLAFQENLEKLPQTAHDDSHAPCLLVIDLDYFKRINDGYGHLAGDQVLKAVAERIRESVRGRDMVARFGGEEFAVLLRDTPRTGCKAVAENVRSSIENAPVELAAELGVAEPLAVTASLGGAWLRDDEAIEAFIDRADQALYRSKEGGRNRVTWEGMTTEI